MGPISRGFSKTREDFDRMANDMWGRESWELVSVLTRQNAHGSEWIRFFRRLKR